MAMLFKSGVFDVGFKCAVGSCLYSIGEYWELKNIRWKFVYAYKYV